ncbi:MAG: hypothetical protein IPO02_04925 [Bacteroidetes bacterium]|nr:hypothetical protein [Bacteroidota bacterium]
MKKKTILSIGILLVGMSSLMQSCYNDNKQDLLADSICDTTNVSFSTTISSVAVNYCTSCHGGGAPSGGISLEGYNNISIYAGACYNAMYNGTMPQGSNKLDDCTIKKFKSWMDAGKPNN